MSCACGRPKCPGLSWRVVLCGCDGASEQGCFERRGAYECIECGRAYRRARRYECVGLWYELKDGEVHDGPFGMIVFHRAETREAGR